ncbi:hypothetical protein [Saccharopolyspora thermophila]|uniref:hypothetical protein n=1 Tax=Saccharopolyspora thermophila TaxID=89367 RepID=UPI001E497AEF|nr:hypothetical protein [Saccharopolyspora subtropica]
MGAALNGDQRCSFSHKNDKGIDSVVMSGVVWTKISPSGVPEIPEFPADRTAAQTPGYAPASSEWRLFNVTGNEKTRPMVWFAVIGRA